MAINPIIIESYKTLLNLKSFVTVRFNCICEKNIMKIGKESIQCHQNQPGGNLENIRRDGNVIRV